MLRLTAPLKGSGRVFEVGLQEATRSALRALLALSALGIALSCSSAARGVHVSVEGELSPGVDFDRLTVEVTVPGQSAPLASQSVSGAELHALPMTFNLVSGPRSATSDELRVTARAHLGLQLVSQASAQVRPEPGSGAVLTLRLTMASSDAGVDAGEVPDAGDAGTADAGGATDAGDAGPTDAGGATDAGDAGPSDAGGPLDAGAPTTLKFDVEPTSPVARSVAFSVQPSVSVRDAAGQLVATATHSITLSHFSEATCTTPASGFLRVAVNPVQAKGGIAAFDAVAFTLSSTVYLKASSPGLASACSGPIQASKVLFAEGSSSAGLPSVTSPPGHGFVAFSDLDADGWTDAVFDGPGLDGGPRLYRNTGSGSFAAGTSFWRTTRSIILGDCDDDGLRDGVFTMLGTELYKNRGDGGFSRATGASNLYNSNPEGAAFFDYDQDGLLDLIHPDGTIGSSSLWRNTGNCVFTDNTTAAGLLDAGLGNGEQVVAVDYDLDGDVDVFYGQGQDFDAGLLTVFVNRGNGTFHQPPVLPGPPDVDRNAGFALGDLDNDGDFDLVVGHKQAPGLSFFRNRGDGTFLDETSGAGTLSSASAVAGVILGDFDQDGLLDIFAVGETGVDQLFRNRGGINFAILDSTVGLGNAAAVKTASGAAAADIDNDGDLDVLVNTTNGNPLQLYVNQANGPNYLRVKVRGRGQAYSPKDGTGVVVLLYDETGTVLRAVRAVSGGGALGQDEPILHFGLANSWGGADGRYVLRAYFNSGLYQLPQIVVPAQVSLTVGSTSLPQTLELVEPP